MMRTGKLLLVFFLALIFSAAKARAATYSVTITATVFIPATLQVSAGDQVIFLNSDEATQSARTTDASGFNTGDIGPGESKTVTLNTAGTYSYYSAYNSNLTGTITVIGTSGSLTDTTDTTTTSTTDTTSTVATTQPQPVSGVFENLLILVGSGFALLGFGWQARKNNRPEPVLDLPLVSSSAEAQSNAHHSS